LKIVEGVAIQNLGAVFDRLAKGIGVIIVLAGGGGVTVVVGGTVGLGNDTEESGSFVSFRLLRSIATRSG
jgi:hypothetical protein